MSSIRVGERRAAVIDSVLGIIRRVSEIASRERKRMLNILPQSKLPVNGDELHKTEK